jgi:hypothetical protein
MAENSHGANLRKNKKNRPEKTAIHRPQMTRMAPIPIREIESL